MKYTSKLFISLLFIVFICGVRGIYVSTDISSEVPWATTLVHMFGMAQGGIISIDYDVTSEDRSVPNESYLLLLVAGEHATRGWYNSMPDQGDFTFASSSVSQYCNTPSLYRNVVSGSGSGTITHKLGDYNTMYSDRFSVYALQCLSSNTNSSLVQTLTTHLEVSMVNLLPNTPIDSVTTTDSDHVSHLAISVEFSPRLYEGLLMIHCFLLLGLCGQLFVGSYYRNGIRSIHWLFLATEFIYCVHLACVYSQWYYYSIHGFLTYSFNLLPEIVEHVQQTLTLLSMLGLSLGYTLVRDELSPRETQLSIMCFVVFFINGFFTASCDAYDGSRYGEEKGQSGLCRGCYSMGYLMQTFIFLGAILGMNYNVTALRVQVAATPWSASTPLAYARSKQFTMFRYVFLLYLMLPLTITILDVSIFTCAV